MKISYKKKLQQIALNHFSDIEFKQLMRLYKDYTKEYSWGYQDILSPESHTREIYKIHKDFWSISSLHVYFSVPKCLDIPKLNIAYKKNQQFWDQVCICPRMSWYPQIIYYHCILKPFLPLLNFISKNWIYSFFLIFWQTPISISCWMPCLYLF